MWNFLVANIKRAVFNKIFIMTVMGIVMLECLDILPELLLVMEKDRNKIIFHETVINLLAIGGSMTLYNLFTVTIGALPSAGCYCDDMENHFITNIIYRSSYTSYSATLILTCAVSSFLCLVLGEVIFVILLSFLVPLHYEDSSFYVGSWQTLEEGKYVLHIIYVILLRGLRASFFAIVSFTASAYIKNKFFVYAMPSIVYYFILYSFSQLAEAGWEIFRKLNVGNVYFTFQLGLDKELESLGTTLLYTIAVGILFWFFFDRKIRRTA